MTQYIVSSGQTANYAAGSGNSVLVNNGGFLTNATASNGGIFSIQAGGSSYNTLLSSGGVEVVSSGGRATKVKLVSGGSVLYNYGGYVSGVTMVGSSFAVASSGATITDITDTGGALQAFSGGLISNATVNGGVAVAYSGGKIYNATVEDATLSAASGGVVSGSIISSGATLVISGTASNTTVNNSGAVRIASGGTATTTTVNNGGTVYASSGSTLGNASVTSGGTISALAGAKIAGTITLADGATAIIPSTAGGIIDLQGNTNAGLTITGTGNPTTVISGFSGTTAGSSDSITLANVKAVDVTKVSYSDANHVVLTLKDGSSVTMNIIGVQAAGYTLTANSDGDLVYEVCFLADSMIKTPSGDTAVQDLTIGDTVYVYDNGQHSTQKVIWTGRKRAIVNPHRTVDEAGFPVRILKNAIGEGVPYKDMLITAEHCLFFDGKFVPARILVNETSIFYDKSLTSYDYYHIETERHSVLMADGMLTESYLDTGNRRAFRQDGAVASLMAHKKTWNEDSVAPLCVNRSFVEPIFRDIELRAQSAGLVRRSASPALTDDTDLHLITDFGQIIRPLRQANDRVMFMIPASVESVRLISHASRPSDTLGPFVDDRRNLGVLVGEVSLFASRQTINLTAHFSLSSLSGWHNLESSRYRWTNGDATLLLKRDNPFSREPSILSIQVVSSGPYLTQDQSSPAELREVG
ncbi:Hint domain-containing protein [Gluconobacter cerinus]|uniref:Hint domain-containing protein n=1 Tax=Gluconobacter cerinus TaxID=38307 RepID=UPI001B8BB635|nr:Hint domain-containing protein [Gluconobacter cerinus]MBS1073189.1 Hint domain-containing protein [Gluconobacter cerinus]